MRQHVQPVVVGDEGVEKPKSLPLSDHEKNEDWLQELLFNHPELLPVRELSPVHEPLVPLCRELLCSQGAMDIVYGTPTGQIAVVETKLWRNTESRRRALAQTIDYAAALSRWSYDEFEEGLRSDGTMSKLKRNVSLYDYLASNSEGSNLDESEFIDAVSDTLQNGRFLLLIVGDGIRGGLEHMAEYLQATPHLLFRLALVEMPLYRLADERLLVTPRTLARTEELRRAVVEVRAGREGRPAVRVRVESMEEEEGTGRQVLNEDEFFSLLAEQAGGDACDSLSIVFDELQANGIRVEPRSNSMAVRADDPGGSGRSLSLAVFRTDGTFYAGWLQRQVRDLGLSPEIAYEHYRGLARVCQRPDAVTESEPQEFGGPPVPVSSFAGREDELVSVIVSTVQKVRDERR